MNDALTVTDMLPGFLDYLAADRHYSLATIKKYGENVQWFAREIGNLPTASIGPQHFIALKARVGEHGGKAARMASIICAMKSLLAYGRDVLAVPVCDLTKVRVPRSPRKEVIYLNKDELEQFLSSIPLRTWAGEARLAGYRFRAIAETLAAIAMRISEAVSLNRDSIDLAKRQAKITGKGNKERTVFFTDRALGWIVRYLDLRTDQGPALFTTSAGNRVTPNLVEAMFKRHVKALDFSKPVTPHVIRHTTATMLLQNGCPIGFIKEILGHERLETTCRFYLGILNKADTQRAHQRYANFDVSPTADRMLTLPPGQAEAFPAAPPFYGGSVSPDHPAQWEPGSLGGPSGL